LFDNSQLRRPFGNATVPVCVQIVDFVSAAFAGSQPFHRTPGPTDAILPEAGGIPVRARKSPAATRRVELASVSTRIEYVPVGVTPRREQRRRSDDAQGSEISEREGASSQRKPARSESNIDEQVGLLAVAEAAKANRARHAIRPIISTLPSSLARMVLKRGESATDLPTHFSGSG
jgi:hypothetical protein